VFAGLLRKTATPGITGIGMDSEGIAITQLVHAQGQRPSLLAGEYIPYGDKGAPNTLLQTLAQKYCLQHAYCSSVLEGADYKLLLTEAPDVPAEELPAAMRWRVKDLLDAPVAEITLDVIKLPSASGGQRNSVYVVAARNSVIRQRIDLLQEAKVNLQVIDIAEMAQRNIAALLPQDKMGLAMLSLRPHHSLITMTREGELYMSRTLNIGLEAIYDLKQREAAFNQVVLEIQRSLDYYESHFRQAPIRQLSLLPLPSDTSEFVSYLSHNLSIEVKPVDLAELIDPKLELPQDLQAKLFVAFGAALRTEVS
jgi:MSHA biogenesis protein MshI